MPPMNSTSPSSLSMVSRQKATIPSCMREEGIKRGPWTPEEDEILAEFVRREGEGRWRTLPKRAGLRRCGKSCRLRWMNYLRPSIRRGPISLGEEDLILRLHRLLGNRWSLIAGRIPGRTDNEIKNYWNTHLSKKLISQGIDPRTHKPLSNGESHIDNNFNNDGHYNYVADHNHNPIQAPVFLGETKGGINSEEEHGDYFQGMDMNMEQEMPTWQNIEGIDGFGDEVFSSFLDSLVTDSTSVHRHQQNQLPEKVNNGDNNASTSSIINELGFSGPLSTLWGSPPYKN